MSQPDLSSLLGAASALSPEAKLQLMQQLQAQLGLLPPAPPPPPVITATGINGAAAHNNHQRDAHMSPPSSSAMHSSHHSLHAPVPPTSSAGASSPNSKRSSGAYNHHPASEVPPTALEDALNAHLNLSPSSSMVTRHHHHRHQHASPHSAGTGGGGGGGGGGAFDSLLRAQQNAAHASSLTSSLDSRAMGSPYGNSSLVSTLTSSAGSTGGWRSSGGGHLHAGLFNSALLNSGSSITLGGDSSSSRSRSQRGGGRGGDFSVAGLGLGSGSNNGSERRSRGRARRPEDEDSDSDSAADEQQQGGREDSSASGESSVIDQEDVRFGLKSSSSSSSSRNSLTRPLSLADSMPHRVLVAAAAAAAASSTPTSAGAGASSSSRKHDGGGDDATNHHVAFGRRAVPARALSVPPSNAASGASPVVQPPGGAPLVSPRVDSLDRSGSPLLRQPQPQSHHHHLSLPSDSSVEAASSSSGLNRPARRRSAMTGSPLPGGLGAASAAAGAAAAASSVATPATSTALSPAALRRSTRLHSSDFVLGELLGCGSLGAKVYRAENRLTGEKVAVKVFDFEGVSLGGGTGGSVGSSSSSGGGGNGGADHDGADDGSSPPSSQRVDARESVRREVASWCTLTNGLANLLPVYGAAVHGSSQLWVVSQLQDLGSCAAMITRRRKVGLLPPAPAPAPNGSHFMPEKLVAFVLRAALLGLQQLYSAYPASAAPPPGHGSVKASSLLVSRTGKVVLSDRAARQRLDRTFYPNGRPGGGAAGGGMGFVMSEVFWMPPEAIAASNALPRPQDVWQLGILALELREGAPPHAGAVPLRVVNLIPMGPAPRLRHAASSSELLADFVAKCCNKDPQSRPTVEALLQHPFIAAAENTDPQELVAFAVEV